MQGASGLSCWWDHHCRSEHASGEAGQGASASLHCCLLSSLVIRPRAGRSTYSCVAATCLRRAALLLLPASPPAHVCGGMACLALSRFPYVCLAVRTPCRLSPAPVHLPQSPRLLRASLTHGRAAEIAPIS